MARLVNFLLPLVIFGSAGLGLVLLPFTVWGTFFLGLGILLFVVCIKKIPADPPSVGLVTFLGARTNIIKREGLRFRLPKILEWIEIDMSTQNMDIRSKEFRTADGVALLIPTSFTFKPSLPHLNAYIATKKSQGVKDIAEDVIITELREWASGIPDYKIALGANEEATGRLIKAIAGIDLPVDPTERSRFLRSVRLGNGTQEIPTLGIVLGRLNIGEIVVKPGSPMEAAVDKQAKEKAERDAEKTELTNVLARIQEIVTGSGGEISYARAIDLVQTERGKAKRRIFDIPGLSEAAQAIAQTLKGGKI